MTPSERGQKIAQKLLEKDPHYYEKIGSKGGKISRTGGFYNNPSLARTAALKSAKIRRRNRSKISIL